MHSIKQLLDMIATEAIEGGAQDHCFDEFRNKDFVPPKREYEPPRIGPKLPPIVFKLELIKKSDGSYEWVE